MQMKARAGTTNMEDALWWAMGNGQWAMGISVGESFFAVEQVESVPLLMSDRGRSCGAVVVFSLNSCIRRSPTNHMDIHLTPTPCMSNPHPISSVLLVIWLLGLRLRSPKKKMRSPQHCSQVLSSRPPYFTHSPTLPTSFLPKPQTSITVRAPTATTAWAQYPPAKSIQRRKYLPCQAAATSTRWPS